MVSAAVTIVLGAGVWTVLCWALVVAHRRHKPTVHHAHKRGVHWTQEDAIRRMEGGRDDVA